MSSFKAGWHRQTCHPSRRSASKEAQKYPYDFPYFYMIPKKIWLIGYYNSRVSNSFRIKYHRIFWCFEEFPKLAQFFSSKFFWPILVELAKPKHTRLLIHPNEKWQALYLILTYQNNNKQMNSGVKGGHVG